MVFIWAIQFWTFGSQVALTAAVGGTVAIGLGVIGAEVSNSKQEKENEKAAKSAASASSASVASAESWSSVISVSKMSVSSESASIESGWRASLATLTSAQAAAASADNPALNVFTFDDPATRSKRDSPKTDFTQPTVTSATSSSVTQLTPSSALPRRMELSRRGIATNATGWPIAPVGVPQFNFDDCGIDVKAHLDAGGNFTVYQPNGEPQTVQVDNIPPRCMVLANVMIPLPDSKSHAIAFGTASIKWLNMGEQEINDLKTFFNSNGTTPLPGA